MATKIMIKTTQEEFQVDVEPSQTVAELKAEINNSKGYDVGTQKLIFSGKPLADGEILGTIGFKEKDFLLLLMSKSKQTPPTTSMPSSKGKGVLRDNEQPAKNTENSSGDVINLFSPQLSGLSSSSSTNTGNSWQQASSSFSSSNWQPPAGPSFSNHANTSPMSGDMPDFNSFAEMMRTDPSMRQMFIDMASQKDPAFGQQLKENPELLDLLVRMAGAHADQEESSNDAEMLSAEEREAVQRIMELGFDEKKVIEAYLVADKNEEHAVNYLLSAHSSEDSDSADTTSQRLTSQEIRQLASDDPAFKQRLLEHIEQDEPALAQQIKDNPALFDVALEHVGVERKTVRTPTKICLTRQEWVAVDRLVELGFPKWNAAEAYVACDKDEERAANLLLSNPESYGAEKDESDLNSEAAQVQKQADNQAMDCDPPNKDVEEAGPNDSTGPMEVETDLGEGSSQSVITATAESDKDKPAQVVDRIPSPSPPSRQVGTIMLNMQDGEVIQNLMDCGFTEQQAVEAYLVSDKDPQRAMNYLLDQQ